VEADCAKRPDAAAQTAHPDARNGDPESDDPLAWNEEIYVMNADGSDVTRLTHIPGNDHWPPTWSPDGRQITFTSDGCENNAEVFVVDADGSNLVNLSRNNALDAFPSWRPQPQRES
jgi:Tol biopolymer transport system component